MHDYIGVEIMPYLYTIHVHTKGLWTSTVGFKFGQ